MDNKEQLRLLISQTFGKYANGAASIDRHQLKCAFLALTSYKPSKTELNLMVGEKQFMDQPSFETYMLSRMLNEDPEDHVRRAFKAFDQRDMGWISREDVHRVFASAAPATPSHVIDEVFDQVDLDQDGRVSCREFRAMMRIHPPT